MPVPATEHAGVSTAYAVARSSVALVSLLALAPYTIHPKRQKLREKKRKAKARKAAVAGKEEKQRDVDDWRAWEEATMTPAGLVPPS